MSPCSLAPESMTLTTTCEIKDYSLNIMDAKEEKKDPNILFFFHLGRSTPALTVKVPSPKPWSARGFPRLSPRRQISLKSVSESNDSDFTSLMVKCSFFYRMVFHSVSMSVRKLVNTHLDVSFLVH